MCQANSQIMRSSPSQLRLQNFWLTPLKTMWIFVHDSRGQKNLVHVDKTLIPPSPHLDKHGFFGNPPPPPRALLCPHGLLIPLLVKILVTQIAAAG